MTPLRVCVRTGIRARDRHVRHAFAFAVSPWPVVQATARPGRAEDRAGAGGGSVLRCLHDQRPHHQQLRWKPRRTGGQMNTLFTVGHSTRTQEELLALLHRDTIATVIDVRRTPASRRHPHVARGELEHWLPANGIAYRWESALGGRRKAMAASQNVGLRHPSFRGYADYMETPPFWDALDTVLAEARHNRVVILCSEALWWRCHRRLIADAVVLGRSMDVHHLGASAHQDDHRVTDAARWDGTRVVYDVRTEGDLGRSNE